MFLNHVSAASGAEYSLVDAVKGFDRSRYDLLAVLPGPGRLADLLAAQHVRIFVLPFRRFRRTRNPFRLMAALFNVLTVSIRLARLIRRERVDLVQANSTTAHLYGGWAARWARVPCLWHCRDLVDLGLLGPGLAARASRILAISETVNRHLQKLGTPDKVVTLYNPLDAEAWDPVASPGTGGPLIGMAGQLEPWKKQDVFLKAAARIAALLPEARFVVAGGNPFDDGGAYPASLRRLTKEYGLEDRLTFTGQQQDMAPVLGSLDLLIHPAEREPLGRVILEAMALGKPVIAVKGAGPAEIIRDGIDGILVEPGDDEAMADAAVSLLNDPPRMVAMGRAGRERVRHDFSLARHMADLEAVYDSLLPRPRPVRVAYVMAEFPSISETFILREIMALEEQGVEILLFSLRKPSSRLMHAEAAPFLPRVHVGRRRFVLSLFSVHGIQLAGRALADGDPDGGSRVRMLARLVTAAGFAEVVRREPVDRVHAHFAYVTADVGRMMAALLGVPFSVSAHAWDLYTRRAGALQSRLKGADFAAFCTAHGLRYARERLPAMPAHRLVLLRHGVFVERYMPVHATEPVILAVGRLEEKKGFRHLVEACLLLKQAGVRFSCVVAGEGRLRRDLEQQVEACGLRREVAFKGEMTLDQLMDLYGTAMVVAVPSKAGPDGDLDGLPNVVLEAMAMEIPVVASAAAAIPEAISDGVQGLLVPPGDGRALADALTRVLGDEAARRRMGRAGRETVCREFDSRRNAEKWVHLFTEQT